MIKHISLLGVLALFTACTSTDKETGDTSADADTDTDTDTDTDIAFEFGGTDDNGNTTNGTGGSCADGVCIYRITTTTAAGSTGIDIIESADIKYHYEENHTGFELEQINMDGSETYVLRLDWVTDPADQVDGSTTLLNEDVIGSEWATRLTWHFYAESADMTEGDCFVTGHDVGWYGDRCTTTGR